MFALLDNGSAICLADYKDIKKNAVVPPVNELWTQVEECVKKNGWGEYTQPAALIKTDLDIALEKRARAYSNPVTGSDRYFAEAARKRAAGDEDGAAAAEQSGLAAVADIKAAIPLPDAESGSQ